MQLSLKLRRRKGKKVQSIVSAVDQGELVRELAALMVEFFQSQREETKTDEAGD